MQCSKNISVILHVDRPRREGLLNQVSLDGVKVCV
jgi:hypothetical protein